MTATASTDEQWLENLLFDLATMYDQRFGSPDKIEETKQAILTELKKREVEARVDENMRHVSTIARALSVGLGYNNTQFFLARVRELTDGPPNIEQ